MMTPTRILLVEDSLSDAALTLRNLRDPEYQSTHVQTLREATASIGASDIVLLDLSLPDSDGLGTFLSLNALNFDVPIVVLTGMDDEDMAVQAIKLGAQDYLSKNTITENSLRRCISFALQRKQAEAERAELLKRVAAHEELEINRKLKTLEKNEEFVATLTHDLKNPLIGTNRVLEFLVKDEKIARPEFNRVLGQIIESNDALLTLIGTLLDVYKNEQEPYSGLLEPLDLTPVVLKSIERMEEIASRQSIVLASDIEPFLPPIYGNQIAIGRVLQNLLDNALKFTPSGGRIETSVSTVGTCVVLKVQDSGLGISTEEQSRLFQRYGQMEAGRKYTHGSGLGLYLCKQIIEGHKGTIVCNSSPGQGTTFTIVFPSSDSELDSDSKN